MTMRLQLNRLERRLLDAETGKSAAFRFAHDGDKAICLSPRELRDLLTYIERLEQAMRDGARLDDRTVDKLKDHIQAAVRDSLSDVVYDASYAIESALKTIPAVVPQVIA